MKFHKIIGGFCLLGLLISCYRDDIVHPYNVDLSIFSKIDTSKSIDLNKLPTTSYQYSKKENKLASNTSDPNGCKNQVEYNLPSNTPGRSVNIELRIFENIQAAKHFQTFLSENIWYQPKIEKFNKGIFPNGLEYCASYIVQHRSDPEGCSLPMDSYSSFLLIRSGHNLIMIRVHEVDTSKPLGVTASDMVFAEKLLNN